MPKEEWFANVPSCYISLLFCTKCVGFAAFFVSVILTRTFFSFFCPLVPSLLPISCVSPPCFFFSHVLLSSAYFCAKLTGFFLFSPPLCFSVIDVLPVSLCLAFLGWSVLLQLSVSQSAYDSQTSDELSANQSGSFSSSRSAQLMSCFDSGPSSAHSSTGASRQVSVGGQKGTFL